MRRIIVELLIGLYITVTHYMLNYMGMPFHYRYFLLCTFPLVPIILNFNATKITFEEIGRSRFRLFSYGLSAFVLFLGILVALCVISERVLSVNRHFGKLAILTLVIATTASNIFIAVRDTYRRDNGIPL